MAVFRRSGDPVRPNILVGVSAVLIGVVYTAQAFGLPKAMVGNPWAPLYFPIGLGILMTGLGLLLILLDLRKALAKASDGATLPRFNRFSLLLILGTSVACVAYAMVFEKLGFVVSTIAFLGALLFMINGPKAWKMNVVITLGFVSSAWYIFVRLFQINLP